MAKYNQNVFIRQGSDTRGLGTRMLSESVMLIESSLYDRKTLKKIPLCDNLKNTNYRLMVPSWDGFFPWCSYNSGIFVNNTGGRFGGNTGNGYTQLDETNHWLEKNARFLNYWYDDDAERFVYVGGSGNGNNDTVLDSFSKKNIKIEHSRYVDSNSYGSIVYPIGDIGEDVVFVPVTSTSNNGWHGYPTLYNKQSMNGKRMKTDFSSYYTWLIKVDYTNFEALYLVRSQNTADTSIWKWNYKTDTYFKSTNYTSQSGYEFKYPVELECEYNGSTIKPFAIKHNFDKHQPSTIFFDYGTGYYGYYQCVVWHSDPYYKIAFYKVLYDEGLVGEAPTLISISQVTVNEPIELRDLNNNEMYSENVYVNGTIPRLIDNGNKLQVIYIGYNDKNSCIKTYSISNGELTLINISYLLGHHFFSGQNNGQYKGHSQSVKFLDNGEYDEIIVNYTCENGDWSFKSNDTSYVNYGSSICMLYKRDENYNWYEAWNDFRPYNASFVDKKYNHIIGLCKNHAADFIDGEISYNHSKYYIESLYDKKVNMMYKINESDLIYDGIDKEVTIMVASQLNQIKIIKTFKLEIIGDTSTVFKATDSKIVNITTSDTMYVNVILTLKDSKNFEIKEYII